MIISLKRWALVFLKYVKIFQKNIIHSLGNCIFIVDSKGKSDLNIGEPRVAEEHLEVSLFIHTFISG